MKKDMERPWYQEPYVWMMILIPASAVVMGVVMISLAIITDDGLVADDYYKRGKEINRVLTRDIAATEMGITATSSFDHVNGKVMVVFDSNARKIHAGVLRLRLLHATRAGFDQDLVLQRLPDGRYYALFKTMAPGRWHLQLESEHWRLMGELILPNGKSAPLLPISV